MTDIVKRLRATSLYEGHGEESSLPEQAADTIEALQARVRDLEEDVDEFEDTVSEAEAELSRLEREDERRAAQPEPPADLVALAEERFGWAPHSDTLVPAIAAYAAEYAAELQAKKEKARQATLQAEDNVRQHLEQWKSRAEAAEQALANVRSALSGVDYASLPDDYPVIGIARLRMQALHERTLYGRAEIGRRKAAEQALAEEREAHNAVAARLARLDGILSRILWTNDRRPASDPQTQRAIADLWQVLIAGAFDAAIRARKGGDSG